MNPNWEGTLSMPSSHTPDALVVAFDDHHGVANAGLALTEVACRYAATGSSR